MVRRGGGRTIRGAQVLSRLQQQKPRFPQLDFH